MKPTSTSIEVGFIALWSKVHWGMKLTPYNFTVLFKR